jgi:hypothetical protein
MYGNSSGPEPTDSGRRDAVPDAIRRLKSLWKPRSRETSFKVISVEKVQLSTTGEAVRTPLPSRPPAQGAVSDVPSSEVSNVVANSSNQPSQTLGQGRAPANFQGGVAANGEYRSVYHPLTAVSQRHEVRLDRSERYVAYRCARVIQPMSDVSAGARRDGSNTAVGVGNAVPSCSLESPSKRVANDNPVGTPLSQNLAPTLANNPQYGSQTAHEIQVREWLGRSEIFPVVVEHQYVPCNHPLGATAPSPTASNEGQEVDERRTLPSERPRAAAEACPPATSSRGHGDGMGDCVTFPGRRLREADEDIPKIETSKTVHAVKQPAPHPASWPQPRLRKQTGHRSLREAAMARDRSARTTPLPDHGTRPSCPVTETP